MKLNKFDFRSLQRYFSPQASKDLNEFLERLPQTAGNTILIAAGIAWGAAAALGLYTTIQVQMLTELRAELKETTALQPPVPRIRDVPVNPQQVAQFSNDLENIYAGLTIKSQGAAILLSSPSTGNFGQFREAIGHVQNGGSGWRVSLDRLCVGRECDRDKLAALLKINKVSVDKPS